eukprot:TRINITY_DN7676_c0_g1_i1.p1 TRINITY_DN7676_c0_g1~~TRINITY_DN7676_c0_g1_i1.p1  ORF type:complete len:134 (+),score=17.26 TRINITY_DN7676_c0_g1_i1:77-478(+)
MTSPRVGSAPSVDVKQNFEEAVAMCKAASAEAAEEHTVKRRRHLQGVVLALILCLFVIIGIRRTMKPKAVKLSSPSSHVDTISADRSDESSLSLPVPPPPRPLPEAVPPLPSRQAASLSIEAVATPQEDVKKD